MSWVPAASADAALPQGAAVARQAGGVGDRHDPLRLQHPAGLHQLDRDGVGRAEADDLHEVAGVEAALVGEDRRVQRGGEGGHGGQVGAGHRLLDEGRAEGVDVAQHAHGGEGGQRLVVVQAEVDRVAELGAHRLEVGEVLAVAACCPAVNR